MLVVTQQPRIFCPVSKSRPITWQFASDSIVQSPGSFPAFTITFETGGANNGDTLTVLDTTFEVDDALPYSPTTFDATGNQEDAARNLADAMRSTYEFQGWFFWVTSSGPFWSVNGFLEEETEIQPFTVDTAGMSNTVTGAPIQLGSAPVLNNVKIWFQLYNNEFKVGVERYTELIYNPAQFPAWGLSRIDLTRQAGGLVASTLPRYSWNTPQPDPSYHIDLHLRYGLAFQQPDCSEPVRNEVFETADITVTNSVFQLHEVDEFLNHCPNATMPVRFLTNRTENRVLCRSVHEWVHLWVEKNAFLLGNYRVRYSFYKEGNDPVEDFIQSVTYDFQVNNGQAYQIALGPANNEVWDNTPANTHRYTVQVLTQVIDEFGEPDFILYTDKITRYLKDCNCKAAEVYFLEDRGSWNTVVFEYLDERQLEQEAIEFERPTGWNNSLSDRDHLYVEGGRYSQATSADQVFVLISERLREGNRKDYEQLLRSPLTYIKSIDENGNEKMRRIIFDRGSQRILKRGEGIRLPLTFRFANELRTH